MADIHEGGCHCDTVRYRVVGTPMLAGVCHCTSCQRRSGSAFLIPAYFAEQDVAITRGVLKTYEYRADESHRWVKTEFCPTCGTLVTWTAEAAPGGRGIGKALLLEALARARTMSGLEDLILAVMVGNERARALYLAVGFAAVTREPRYLKIGEQYFDIEWMHLSVNREHRDSERSS